MDTKAKLAMIRGLDVPPPEAQGDEPLQMAKKGSYLQSGDEVYFVAEIGRYLDVKWRDFSRRKNEYWVTELTLIHVLTGESHCIEWEYDDSLEVCKTLRELKLRDIEFEGGSLTQSRLEYIVDEEEGEVVVAGKVFAYSEDETWAALYHREGAEEIPVRMCEFEASDGTCLTVELWEEEGDRPSREAFLSRSVSSDTYRLIPSKGVIS